MFQKKLHSVQSENNQQKKIIVRKASKQKATFLKKDKLYKIDDSNKQLVYQDNFQNIKFVNSKAILKSQTSQQDKKSQMLELEIGQTQKARTSYLMTVSSQKNFLPLKKSKTQYFSNPQADERYFSIQNKTFQDQAKYILQMKHKIRQQNIKLLTQNQQQFKNLPSIQSEKDKQNESIHLKNTTSNEQLIRASEDHQKIICIQCRYHLQKQNNSAKIKFQLQRKIQELQNKLRQTSSKEGFELLQSLSRNNPHQKYEKSTSNSNKSVQNKALHQTQQFELQKAQLNEESLTIQSLNLQIQQKNKQIDILSGQLLISEFTISHLKQKVHELNQNLKYLSIENRTLLKTKTQIMKFQLQNIKLIQQRDSFKKKVIQMSKTNEKLSKEMKFYKLAKNKENIQQSSCSESLQQSLISLSPQTQSLEHSFIDNI